MSDCVYIGPDSADVGKQKKNTHTGLYDLVSEPRVQTCRHLVKTSMTAPLHRQLTCPNCHRSGESPSRGAAINSRVFISMSSMPDDVVHDDYDDDDYGDVDGDADDRGDDG